ncbi:hypothetical protein CCR75_005297 [Bremia lactucae]|uniref:Uncharacterized protein n=1 Tax=Bremia lactucae TaxID=4779 RepID=A0A976FQC0_BRELC|nr:hypothetical protein CCR75_005297 [Bremia lactucae]
MTAAAVNDVAAPAQESLLDRLWPMLRMFLLYYAVTSAVNLFAPRPQHEPQNTNVVVKNADNSNSGPHSLEQLQHFHNSFHLGARINLRVYVTPDEHFSFIDVETKQEALRWFEEALSYDSTPNADREDGVWNRKLNVTVDDHLLSNGSVYAHVFVTKDGCSPNPADSTYDAMGSLYRSIALTTFRSPPKIVKKRNLLETHTLEQEEAKTLQLADIDSGAYISMWKPSLTINVVLDHSTYSTRQPPPSFVSTEMDIDNDTGLYSPE